MSVLPIALTEEAMSQHNRSHPLWVARASQQPHVSVPAQASPDASGWAELLAGWDIAPGSESERALATAVLLDAPRHTPALVRAAERVLRRASLAFTCLYPKTYL